MVNNKRKRGVRNEENYKRTKIKKAKLDISDRSSFDVQCGCMKLLHMTAVYCTHFWGENM